MRDYDWDILIRFVATRRTSTPTRVTASRLLLHIFAAFAEFERELIRERVVTGIRAAQGRQTPRKATPGIQARPGSSSAL
jgi:DNA invertase Pin-like site-specific DNA recombinase